ncbi:hypothetical protein T484DRAFT_1817087 [Baffinella frigidus]|nr:hypothetical protein T484DRAFT_1817087 [Cryptophyta sp. CCMP2293]
MSRFPRTEARATRRLSPRRHAFVTDITASCESWASENLPLEFSYGVAPASSPGGDGNTTAVQVAWTPVTYLPSYSFSLPAGTFAALVRITDALGASVEVNASTLTVWDAPTNETGQEEQDLAAYALAAGAVGRMQNLGQISQVLQASKAVVDAFAATPLPRGRGVVASSRNLLASSSRSLLASSSRRLLASSRNLLASDHMSASSGFASSTDLASSSRKLLASSAAFQARTRRLLLRTVAASTGGGTLSARTSDSALASTLSLSSSPDEVEPDMVQDGGGVLSASALVSSLASLQYGALEVSGGDVLSASALVSSLASLQYGALKEVVSPKPALSITAG